MKLGCTCAQGRTKNKTSWITDASVLAEIWAVKSKAAWVVQKILNGKTWLGNATTAETGAQKLEQQWQPKSVKKEKPIEGNQNWVKGQASAIEERNRSRSSMKEKRT
jgi:hypothetical protein